MFSTKKKTKSKQKKTRTPQELLNVLEIFSLSETDENNFDGNAAMEDNGVPKQSELLAALSSHATFFPFSAAASLPRDFQSYFSLEGGGGGNQHC